jgi:carbamoyltransferase
LTIGAAQYAWHHILGNARINWVDNFTPYLGASWDIRDALDAAVTLGTVVSEQCDDTHVIELLDAGKIVSVYNGCAESGRRALGNRSILADPRRQDMKDRVNAQVKHRQWFRPFAPSILRERVCDWFERDIDSPYMSFVARFIEDKKHLVPAVVHFDGTARLQTVTANDNPWYHAFLTAWEQRSGVPILLNTSFNDKEPICETPGDAIRCFLNTDIDFLYFPRNGIIARKA